MACPNVEEVPGSRRGTRTKSQRQYYVHEANSELDAINAVLSFIPTTVGGLPLLDYTYEETEEIDNAYTFTVDWGYEDGNTGSDLPSSEYRFSFQAFGGHFKQSLSTVSFHTPNGSAHTATAGTEREAAKSVAARYFSNALNVTKDKEGNRSIEGEHVNPPAEVFSLVYRDDNTVIDGAYQLLVESLVGKVNSTSFRGRAAGSVMLVRAQGSRSGGVWTIEFGFGYVPNDTNIPVGDNIVIDQKDGLDMIWTYYEYQVQDIDIEVGVTYSEIIPTSAAAYIERVFPRADLNLLGLPE